MKASLRSWLIRSFLVALFIPCVCAAQELKVTSVTPRSANTVMVTVSGASSNHIAIDVSADLKTWRQAAVAFPSASGQIEVTTAPAGSSPLFFRAYDGPHGDMVVGVQDQSGGPLTNATLRVESTGQVFPSDSTGTIFIPIRLIPFASGFQARVSAPRHIEQLVNIAAFTYYRVCVLAPLVLGPNSLAGHTYRLGNESITFYSNATYKWRAPGQQTTGSFTATKTEGTWEIQLQPSGTALTLNFTSATAGSYSLVSSSGTRTGEMIEIADPDPADGGTFPAPLTLSSVHLQIAQSVLGPMTMRVNLSGGASGTFVISDGPTGSGTYTYTPSGNSAHLRLVYPEWPGDFDDMILRFHSPPGENISANQFTGTQKVGDDIGAFAGTFGYR